MDRSRLYREMVEQDFLTGLAYRRKCSEILEQLRKLADRHEQPLSLAVVDLDQFKEVNDRYGHAVGDQVLRSLAQTLATAFRGEDVVSRWGGEEFVLGMYGMPCVSGVQRLQQVGREFGSRTFDAPGEGQFQVTFSAGIAEYPDHGDTIQKLYRSADAALYAAKAAGRNRVYGAGVAERGRAPA